MSVTSSCSFRRIVLALPVAAACALTASTADAQIAQRFSVRIEGGTGTMLPSHQIERLGFQAVLAAALRLGATIYGPFAVQVSGLSAWAPSGQGDGQEYALTAGVRVEPQLGDIGRLWVDGNLGLAQTGPLSRFGLDVGVGFEFIVSRYASAGPFARYVHIFASSADHPSDAGFWNAGLNLTLRLPRDEPAQTTQEPTTQTMSPDTDADGVLDDTDVCPSEAAGERPDPERRGCPTASGDRDGDGVNDGQDQCPSEPRGETPDPAREGCPSQDGDADGILDASDACPTTAAGEHPDPDRAGCPDGDNDDDSVLNHEDQCPDQHQALHPDPARPGCPSPDRDNDSIPDAADACPEEAGAPSSNARRNGCPGLVRIERERILLLQPVFFANNSDAVLPRSRALLTAVVDAMRASPNILKVSVEGHTDDVGDDAANLELSQRRAASVMAFIVGAGVDASRLEAHGFGETRPVMQGETEESRAANRRVEIRILQLGNTPDAPRANAARVGNVRESTRGLVRPAARAPAR